jgi:hypothetical protein
MGGSVEGPTKRTNDSIVTAPQFEIDDEPGAAKLLLIERAFFE